MLVIIFIPWLLWGFSISTERLHDRDKSAWWIAVCGAGPDRESGMVWGTAGAVLQYILSLAAFALTIWGFVEIGFLRVSARSNRYGPDPLLRTKRKS
jgi:uncharacterized membrane protein YhaH (DUF805 family)